MRQGIPMKFLEFTPESEPLEIFEIFFRDFIPDIFSALRNNRRIEVNHDMPLSQEEIALLFVQISQVLNFSDQLCKIRYDCLPDSIRVEMRIRNGTFVWLRFVPLNKDKEPITKEKENISMVLPVDHAEITNLNNEGYGTIVAFNKIFPPKY